MFSLNHLAFAGAGYILGAFTPGVLRGVKSLFVKEATKIADDAKASASKAASDVAKKL